MAAIIIVEFLSAIAEILTMSRDDWGIVLIMVAVAMVCVPYIYDYATESR